MVWFCNFSSGTVVVGCVIHITLPMSRTHVLSWEMECLGLR